MMFCQWRRSFALLQREAFLGTHRPRVSFSGSWQIVCLATSWLFWKKIYSLILFFNQNMTFTHNSNKFNPFNQKCLIRLLISPLSRIFDFYLDILLIHELTYKVSHHQHKQYVSYLVIGFGKGRQRKVIKIYRQMCETHVGGCTQDACLSTVLITGCQVSDNLLSLLWMLAAVYSLPAFKLLIKLSSSLKQKPEQHSPPSVSPVLVLGLWFWSQHIWNMLCIPELSPLNVNWSS